MKRGSLTVVCGPMYAGKTTYLLQTADKFTASFKPSIDTRYDTTSLASHNGSKGNAFAIKADATGVDALLSLSKSASVVLIDECQFLSDPFVLAIQAIQSRGSKVVCAGLDLDFLGQPFGIMPRLLCLADQVIKLSALCSCGSVARRTYRKSSSMDLIEVGSSDKYEPRCVDCFYK